MTTERAPGFHVRPGCAVDASAYEQFTGRWSRLFVPLVLEAADVQPGDQVLDVCTGTGEAAVAIAPAIGSIGMPDRRRYCACYARKCSRPIK